MNKQEKEKLISFIEKEKENITLKHGNYNQTHFGFIQGTKLIEFIEQLDEPQKVKVKQFVADWYEEHKHNLSNSLWKFTVELNEKTLVTGAIYTEFESWFIAQPRVYEFITRMGKGYEVEEEPKYRIEFPISYGYRYLSKNKSGQTVFTSAVGDYTSEFTEQEIKSIDERYWPFAVPVEKV